MYAKQTAFAVSTPMLSSAFTPGTGTQCRTQRASLVRLQPMRRTSLHNRAATWLMKVGIVYSTVTGNSGDISEMVQENLGAIADEPKDVSEVSPEEMGNYDALVVGAPTWNTGEDELRSGTAWDEYLYDELTSVDLSGKRVAVFGVGDGQGYAENFCDALEELHDCFAKQGATMIGYTPGDSVGYGASKSVRDGKFLGLAVDMTNDPDSAPDRVAKWVAQLKSESLV